MEQFLIDKLNQYNIELPNKPIEREGFTRWGHNNRYWLLSVGEGYAFGDWSQDINEFVFPDNSKPINAMRKLEFCAKIQAEKERRQQEIQQEQKKVADTAKSMFDKADFAKQEHPYLARKHVQAHCAKHNKNTNTLLIPLYDIEGELWSVQYIDIDGNKRFLAGGRKKGCFCPIGTLTDTIYLCEGFATAATIFEATGKYTVAAMDAGNMMPVASELVGKYPNAKIVIAADNDWEKSDNTGVKYATEVAQKYGLAICVPQINVPDMSDFNDVATQFGLQEVKRQLLMQSDTVWGQEMNFGFRVFGASEFLQEPLPKVEFLLYPFIPQNGVSLLYAERGAGKTFMGLAMACAVASGFNFLHFKADKPRKVLYVDGEMDAREMQDRLNLLISGFEQDGKHVKQENLRLFLAGMQENATMPDLATKRGQAQLESYINEADLVIVDNIFSLYTAGRENDADSWVEYNAWSRKLRAKGVALLWIHHTGKDKNRGPRGSSAIEAILNSSVCLEVAPGHKSSDGAIAVVRYTKTRGVAGNAVNDFAAKLIEVCDLNGCVCGLRWELTDKPQDYESRQIENMLSEGKSVKEIVKNTGISRSKVYRIKQQIDAEAH